MNDIQPLKPGKLKRKSKRNALTSVVDLPAVGVNAVSGNLLGDAVMNELQGITPDVDSVAYSLVGLTSESSIHKSQDANHSDLMNDVQVSESGITLKTEFDNEPVLSSPLDALRTEKSMDGGANEFDVSVDDAGKVVKQIELGQTQIVRLSGKKKSAKAAPVVEPCSSAYISQLEDLLEQSREANQKCLDTLAKLQNTNIQNERRYTLNLVIAFSVLAVLTVIGVWGGSSLSSKVKNQDVKFKNEAYLNAVNARKILEDEFDREKRGSAAAFEVYQRIEQGLYEESIEKFVEVRDQLTHPAEIALLEQRIDEIQWKLAENAYHDGVMLFNASNFEQARDAFFKSLSHKENTAYSPRLNYYLAMSLFELGDFEGARRYFAYINSADLSSDMDAQARYYRAIAAEKLGDEAEAYEQFDQFLRKYRYHRLAAEAAKHRAKVESGRRQ